MSKKKIINELKKITLFEDLTQKEINFLSEFLVYEEFDPLSIIIKQGQKNDMLYLINKGEVNVNLTLPNDEEKLITILKASDFFGDVSMLAKREATANIISKNKLSCYGIEEQVLKMLLIYQPELALKLLHKIAIICIDRIKKLLNNINKIRNQNQKNVFESIHCMKSKAKWLTTDFIDEALTQEISIFRELNKKKINKLIKYAKIKFYEKGYLVTTNVETHFIGIVYSGALQFFDKNIPKISICAPGEISGHLTFVAKENILSAISREDTILLQYDSESLRKMHNEDYQIWVVMQEIIYRNIVAFQYDTDRHLSRLVFENK